MTTKSYKCRYRLQLESGNFKIEDKLDDDGLADAFLFASMIYEDGGLSILWLSMDGRTDTPLEPIEKFKAWLLLASELKDEEKLIGSRQQKLLQNVFETTKSWIK